MNKQPIILVGGGGHCRSCIDVIEQEDRFTIKGIIDLPDNKGKTVLGYEIIGSDDDIADFSKSCKNFLITIGFIYNADLRVNLFKKLESLAVSLPVIISPLAYVSKHAKVGAGTIIMHHALINAGASIGKNCIINSKALIEHDAVVEDHCHVSTGAVINGGVFLGRESFWGSNSTSKQYSRVPAHSFIKANTIVK